MGSHLSPHFVRPVVFSLCLVGVLAGHCVAPQTPLEPNAHERERFAGKFIHEKLPLWQQRLHLQDWKVTVLIVHPTELRPHTMGNIHWEKDKKTAVIRVLDASDYRAPFQATLNDMEFTVVHELIHLELVDLPRSEATHSDEENAINRLATALLRFESKDNGPLPASSISE